MIKFNQKALVKPYIDINTKLRQKTKNRNLEKDFFKLMHNAVFGKIMENMRQHKNIKLVTTWSNKEKKLFSIRTKLSYYRIFLRKIMSNRNDKKSNVNEQTCLFRFINIRSK